MFDEREMSNGCVPYARAHDLLGFGSISGQRSATAKFTATPNKSVGYTRAHACTSLPTVMFNQRAPMISAPFFIDSMLMRASELYFDHVQR